MSKTATTPAAKPFNHVLVIGNNHMWAKEPKGGSGYVDALKKARRAASSPKEYIAYLVTEDTYIDGIGYTVSPVGHRPKLLTHKLAPKGTAKLLETLAAQAAADAAEKGAGA